MSVRIHSVKLLKEKVIKLFDDFLLSQTEQKKYDDESDSDESDSDESDSDDDMKGGKRAGKRAGKSRKGGKKNNNKTMRRSKK